MLKQGRVYRLVKEVRKCETCGQDITPIRTRFPFDEEMGIYCGITPSGMLVFRFSDRREGMMNGGNYEEVEVDVRFIAPKK